ncbi:MAG: hypothetical protein JWQ09_4984 [Segetibacter sp.]|nr:hypothetical protein [Segetibacter sp.]
MANPNEYLVFEADQVLTNDHLNQLFYYVDQQNRWTRNKLIGIGIACGLNIVQLPGIIQVTKGVGVTSQGYLILHNTTNYTYFLPYSAIDQPNDLPFTYPGNLPFYKPYCTGKSVYLLLSDDEYNSLESNKQLQSKTISSSPAKFLDDYVVVLFLEATEMDLKNCDAFDCNNKGEKIQLQVRPLLVKKTELPNAVKDKPGKVTGNSVTAKLTAPEIDFKRYNVPYKDLQSSDDVLNAFIQIVDDNTLSTIAKAYTFCYEKYKFLFNTTANPFTTLFTDLKKQRDSIIKNNPVFIQYFYDFIDDLIKAYYEFRVRAWGLVSSCCPDENLFPLHLVLGDATANTTSFQKDAYRQYFIYSPLFERQGNESSEIVFLFIKMQILVKEFVILSQKSIKELDIKITPSQYEFHWLSERAIPYYYKVNDPGSELYKYWKFSRTSHGNAAFNLGYNSNLYNGSPGVLHPLLYDIEYYNFFRVEGHIGLNYKACLSNILQQRQTYNLPFDIVAVSADQLRVNADNLPECNLQDLEADYKVIISEFACKVHVPFCFFSQSPFDNAIRATDNNIAGAAGNKSFSKEEMPSFASIKTDAIRNFNEAVVFSKPGYVKGDFLRKYCPPKPGTVASAYIAALSADGTFTNPLTPNQKNPLINAYYYTFEFIDAVEELMKLLLLSSIATLNMAALKSTYLHYLTSITILTNILAFFNEQAASTADTKPAEWLLEYDLDLLLVEFGVLTSICLDERLQTLKEEYKRRLQLYQLQRSFLYYFKKHPGLEHKAGVPKGGTFVLVYHPAQREAPTAVTVGAFTNLSRQTADQPVTPEVQQTATQAITVMPAQTATVNQAYYDENTIKLIRSFVDDCNDAPIEKKKLIIDILTNFQPKSPGFQIPDDVVIADFYVPYLCCSDCPPIAYVVTEEKPEVTQFDINPKVFLYDDAHNYPFTAKPPVTQANIEQNPFDPTDNLKYPVGLKLWTDEKNVLYLHPAMPDLKQTLKATVTYREVPIEITIIKPDAAFQVQITKDPANNGIFLRVTAKNKDAKSYEWLVNGKNDVFENNATPAPVNVEELMRSTDANEFQIQLTITYELNGNISDNTKAGRLTVDEIKQKSNAGDENPFELKYEIDE